MGYIKLNPKDAERYGVDETVTFDLNLVGRKQRRFFEVQTKKPYGWLLNQLQGVPALDENGNAIPEPVIDAETGEQKLGEDGEPLFEPKLEVSDEALDMFVYLILVGRGVRVAWDDFELYEFGLRIRFGEDGDEGKAEAAETSSASTSST